MSTGIWLQYYASFGGNDFSDTIDWDMEIEGAEEVAYLRLVRLRKCVEEEAEQIPELKAVLDRAAVEIEEMEDDLQEEIEDDIGYELDECSGISVEFAPVEYPDELGEEEARIALEEMLRTGDDWLNEYLSEWSDSYVGEGSLEELLEKVRGEMG